MVSPPKPWEQESGNDSEEFCPAVPPRSLNNSNSLLPFNNNNNNNNASNYNQFNSGYSLYQQPSYSYPGMGFTYGNSSVNRYNPYNNNTNFNYNNNFAFDTFSSFNNNNNFPYNNNNYTNNIPLLSQPQQQQSLTQTAEAAGNVWFQTVHQVVNALSSCTNMLEATFHATYHSFQALLGVSHQFGGLFHSYNSIKGIVFLSLIRHMSKLNKGKNPLKTRKKKKQNENQTK